MFVSFTTTLRFKRNILLLAVFQLVLTACGGGGGGSSPTTPTPSGNVGTTGGSGSSFVPGQFLSAASFRASCQSPRTGINPATGTLYPDQPGPLSDEKNWLRSWSNNLYLWYDEIIDVNPESHIGSSNAYFNLMKTNATTPSGAPKDKFHFSLDTEEFRAQSQSGISAGYGVTFAILSPTTPRNVVVAYAEPQLPSVNAGVDIPRGARIMTIDGVDVVNTTLGSEIDVINDGLFPSSIGESHVFTVQDAGSTVTRSITLVSSSVASDPVPTVTTIDTETGKVGYLLFTDHIATAELELIQAVVQLRDDGISDLVLDLRYNGGGFLDIANELSSMIAGSAATTGRAFESLVFNDKHQTTNPVTGALLSPSTFHQTAQGFSAQSGATLPELNLSRVFILTGPGTCSASESIINGLAGIDLEVIQIGSTTCGKPYGFYPFDNCGTTWFSIQFKGANAKGFGDYSDGFSPANVSQIEGTPLPGCSVADDFGSALGDPAEARLAAALAYRIDGSCPVANGSAANRASVSSGQTREAAVEVVVPKPLWLQNRIMRH